MKRFGRVCYPLSTHHEKPRRISQQDPGVNRVSIRRAEANQAIAAATIAAAEPTPKLRRGGLDKHSKQPRTTEQKVKHAQKNRVRDSERRGQGVSSHLEGLDVGGGELALIVQHLLEVWHVPAGVRGIPTCMLLDPEGENIAIGRLSTKKGDNLRHTEIYQVRYWCHTPREKVAKKFTRESGTTCWRADG